MAPVVRDGLAGDGLDSGRASSGSGGGRAGLPLRASCARVGSGGAVSLQQASQGPVRAPHVFSARVSCIALGCVLKCEASLLNAVLAESIFVIQSCLVFRWAVGCLLDRQP